MKNKPTQPQLTFFFDDENLWPSQELFPLNLQDLNRTVSKIILKDIRNWENYLIITGFPPLSQLVETFGDQHFPNLKGIKIVLGLEPNIKGRKRYSQQ